MREESLIKRVKMLTEGYTFSQPFANYLKEHFRNHPEMGARDRRETREWSFNFFRIGVSLPDIPFEKRLSTACFLCSFSAFPSLSYLLDKHSDFHEADLVKTTEEKIEIVRKKYPAFNTEDIFPMHEMLSPQIKKKEWFLSFLIKPKVWIRVQKNKSEAVVAELKEKLISFSIDEDPGTFSFFPEAALEKTISFQKGYFIIQDKNSQRTREFFHAHPNEHWWDACAGAGGKSILLNEQNPGLNIFATDIRENILKTYSERMRKHDVRSFKTGVVDLSKPNMNKSDKKFDGIIADVPCSGSGTWSRSPEWLRNNIKERIEDHYVPLQRSIVSNILPSLKSGFPLIYITCSVFSQENEENIMYFLDHLPLRLEKTAYLEGYESGSDTLFVARFSKL